MHINLKQQIPIAENVKGYLHIIAYDIEIFWHPKDGPLSIEVNGHKFTFQNKLVEISIKDFNAWVESLLNWVIIHNDLNNPLLTSETKEGAIQFIGEHTVIRDNSPEMLIVKAGNKCLRVMARFI